MDLLALKNKNIFLTKTQVNIKQDPDFSPGGNKVDIMMKNSKQMNKLELPRRPRRHSDASKNDSQSPSPPQRQRARTTTSNNASPRVRSRNSQPSSAEAVNSRLIPSIPRTPRLAFKKLQVRFLHNFYLLFYKAITLVLVIFTRISIDLKCLFARFLLHEISKKRDSCTNHWPQLLKILITLK
jgi:hypothetical protein